MHSVNEILTLLSNNSLLLLMIALLGERYFTLPLHWHPLTLFNLLATYMSAKVNRDNVQQQTLAGLLSCVLLLILVLVPLLIFRWAADLPQLVDLLLLYVALLYQPYRHWLATAAVAIERGHKRRARALMSRLTARDCESLSEPGLVKSWVELRWYYALNYRLAPILAWLLGGIALLLVVRVLVQLHHLWPRYIPRYRHFGQAPAMLTQWLMWLPYQTVNLLLWLTHRDSRWAVADSHGWWLAQARQQQLLAQRTRSSLGGPLRYRQQRYSRARFNAGRQADRQLLRQERKMLMYLGRAATLVITLLLIFSLVYNQKPW
ncbi:cobalamin biosynthesis protein [Idiomarina xiamenensis]|uniref:Cobalamin biosynthesis membrane protein n=1 Tax=Idiomarina xiamenensis 10-D-4 TaxID=740709 RepID=K2L681_9GAMM|nr:cobalamin biosynthesis protein [Idiomarina xiamenensis]EKE85280.1 cobalamin biosynthesis membrane protein [Idiomarina xiamenensis 10-D-4]